MKLDRITFDPAKANGQACIRGLRIPVSTVLRCLAGGMTTAQILADFPDLEAADIAQALQYATILVEDRLVPVS